MNANEKHELQPLNAKTNFPQDKDFSISNSIEFDENVTKSKKRPDGLILSLICKHKILSALIGALLAIILISAIIGVFIQGKKCL